MVVYCVGFIANRTVFRMHSWAVAFQSLLSCFVKKYGSTIGWLHNCRLYIRYRSNSQKNEAEECKSFANFLHSSASFFCQKDCRQYPLAMLMLNLLSKLRYIVLTRWRKASMKFSILFISFLVSSSVLKYNSWITSPETIDQNCIMLTVCIRLIVGY